MATVLNLIWHNLVNDATLESLDLLAGDPNTPNYGWHVEKWVQGVSFPASVNETPSPVVDKLTCLVSGSTVPNLADRIQEMSHYGDRARRSANDPTIGAVVLFKFQANNEADYKIGYVLDIQYKVLETFSDTCGYIEKKMSRLQVIITRRPYWEDYVKDSLTDSSINAAASVCVDYRSGAADIPGDAPARVGYMKISPGTGGDELGRLWMGIRTERKVVGVTCATFQNIWELEDGTNNAAESGITDDAGTDPNGASPGSASGVFVKVIPTDLTWDDTWHEVLAIRATDAGIVWGDMPKQFGLHKWLLRGKVTSGEWQFQLRFGYHTMTDDDFVENQIVDIDNTSWDYFDMGQRQIPLTDTRGIAIGATLDPIDGTTAELRYTIQLWARRISGTGHLYVDCLCPVPMDEGYLIVDDSLADSTNEGVIYIATPFGTEGMYMYSWTTSAVEQVLSFDPFNFVFPPNAAGFLVIVYARPGSSELTDEIDYYNEYYPRWNTLREV